MFFRFRNSNNKRGENGEKVETTQNHAKCKNRQKISLTIDIDCENKKLNLLKMIESILTT